MERTSKWLSELGEALVNALDLVAQSLQASPEELLEMTLTVAAENPEVSRADAVDALLYCAKRLIYDVLHDTYAEQDRARPVTTLAELDKMRQAASSFADQAWYLVQPRLTGSQWPRGQAIN
jgi:hypothetical protein